MSQQKNLATSGSDSPRAAILFGVAIIAVFFGGFGTWAAVAPFDSAVVAPAFVKVESTRKTVQHLEGGIIRQIRVKEGQRVSAGAELIVLDQTQARSNYEIFAKQVDGLRAQEVRLIAELNHQPRVEFPAELVVREADPEIAKILQSELQQFEARRTALEGQTTILRQRIAQTKEQIVGTQAQLTAITRQLQLIGDELKDTRWLYDRGGTTLIRLRQLERTEAALHGQIGELQSNIGKLNEQIGESERQIIQLTHDQQTSVTKDLREVQGRIFEILPRLLAAKDTLDRTTIKSPNDGFVVGLTTFTLGGVIKPGEAVMQVIPEGDTLVLEAQVRVEDIESLRPSLDAIVHLTAFKERLTPIVHGKVTKVAADRLTDQRTGQPYYTIEVTIAHDQLTPERRKNLYPGMPANVSIPFGKRTALDYLVRPLMDSMVSVGREK